MADARDTPHTPDEDSPAAATGLGERRPGLRAAGVAASRLAAPIVARRGGGALARLKAEWAAIAGAEFAGGSWPESLGRGGILRLSAAPAQALEIQHRSPLLIERINLFFGRPAVARIAIVQGPLPLPAKPPQPPPTTPARQDVAALERQLTAVEDTYLRAALNGLGRAVLGAERRDG
jgi:hypothetical protein